MTTKIFNFYDALLQVIDFIISRTSDSLAETMIKAMPLLAPLPNAISIYFIAQHALGYNTVQSFAAAAALECMFFALTEVTLICWDGTQADRRYWWPLGIIGVAFAGYFGLVLWLVYKLEATQGNYAPMAFPFVSLVAAIALGCFRWHKRNCAVVQRPVRRTVQKEIAQDAIPPVAHKEIVQLVQPESPAQSEDAQPDKRQRAKQLHGEGLTIAQISRELDVHRNTASAWIRNGHPA